MKWPQVTFQQISELGLWSLSPGRVLLPLVFLLLITMKDWTPMHLPDSKQQITVGSALKRRETRCPDTSRTRVRRAVFPCAINLSNSCQPWKERRKPKPPSLLNQNSFAHGFSLKSPRLEALEDFSIKCPSCPSTPHFRYSMSPAWASVFSAVASGSWSLGGETGSLKSHFDLQSVVKTHK